MNIEIVFIVIFIILVGLLVYLWYVDVKLRKIDKKIHQHQLNNKS